MSDMTDEEVIAALGWWDCASDPDHNEQCKTHAAPLYGTYGGVARCHDMAVSLAAVREGMALERRKWIADGSTHYDGCQRYHPRCEARMLRGILIDLIARLREVHRRTNLRGEAQWCVRDEERWPCETSRELDRAEARLREVTGDE